MFPNVSGFQWSFGHILFLTIFFSVLALVAGAVIVALIRGVLHLRRGRAEAIRWRQDFEELPEEQRRCRHQIAGQVEERTCLNGFDCRGCGDHARFPEPQPAATEVIFGLSYPSGRLYHRGHTWVEPQADGTVLIGLDEIGQRLVGEPDRVELPGPGTPVQVNGKGWRMEKKGFDVRILSPVEGVVVETGSPRDGFYLRVKPAPSKNAFRHLLRGAEIQAWVQCELERLQMAFAPAGAAAALADGGELMHDLIHNAPEAAWDAILGEVFLEP